MGIFSRIHDLLSTSPKEYEAAIDSCVLAPVRTTCLTRLSLDIDGQEQTSVYVYDGKPVRRLEVGQETYADVVPRDVILRSEFTGTIADTGEFGDSALSIDGQVFGVIGSRLGPILKKAAARGYKVRVKVKRTGTYMPGCPELVALTARPVTIEYWWEKSGRVTEPTDVSSDDLATFEKQRLAAIRKRCTGIEFDNEATVAWIHMTPRTYLGQAFPKHHRVFNPKFEVEKTSKTSSEHVLVKSGKTTLFKLNANYRSSYETVMRNLGKPCKGSLVRDYFGDGDEDDWRMVLVFGDGENATD